MFILKVTDSLLSTFSSILSGHQRSVDQAARGEISVHLLYPWLIMFGANGCWALEKCRMHGEEKIIPEKIKKPEITKTLNISSGGDSQQREARRKREKEEGGRRKKKKRRLVLTASASWEVIRNTQRKATLLEWQLPTWTTPLFLVTRGKFRMINCYVRQIC